MQKSQQIRKDYPKIKDHSEKSNRLVFSRHSLRKNAMCIENIIHLEKYQEKIVGKWIYWDKFEK